MKTELDYKVVETMEKSGGSFVKALAECFRMADDNNFKKLQSTFSEYWEQYRKMSGFKGCTDCDAMGWTAEHNTADTHNPEDGSCMNCPIQVQCDTCEATGLIKEK